MDSFILQDDVAEALADGLPVVALESTLVSHGLPAPHNLQAAQKAEAAIRAAGAVPATIAVIDGRVRVGLSNSELERRYRGCAPGLARIPRHLGRSQRTCPHTRDRGLFRRQITVGSPSDPGVPRDHGCSCHRPRHP